MALLINEMGEFEPADVFDPDANRAKAYGSLARIDTSRLRESQPQTKKTHVRRCKRCGREFPSERGTLYCSDECRRAAKRNGSV